MKTKYGQWKKDIIQRAKRFWYVFAVIVLAFSLLLGFHVSSPVHTPHPSGSTRARSNTTPVKTPRAESSRKVQPLQSTLVIPAIGVNAPIEPVGTLSSGAMAVPVHRPWDGVGWYQNGPRPGEQGSAVIDGHLDRPGGAPAVFWRLRNVQKGDLVLVVHPGLPTLRFQVQQIAVYQPTTAPLQQIFENHSGTFLNLITCAGTWMPDIHQTTLRLVVYTVQI